MKLLFIISALTLSANDAFAQSCQERSQTEAEDVLHQVNTAMPKYLAGAKIQVKLANGTVSEVPAEKFMVVPRKQKTIVGQNLTTKSLKVCKMSAPEAEEKKNLLMLGARKDHTGLDTEVSPDGKSASTISKRGLVLDASYYRRKVLGPVGGGLGIDSNVTPRIFLGSEF